MNSYPSRKSHGTRFFILIVAALFLLGCGKCWAQKAYVIVKASNAIAEYSATNGALVSGTFIQGLVEGPQYLAISGSTLYVANGKDDSVGAYNAITGATIKAGLVTVPKDPYYIAVAGNNLYVLYTGIYGESTIPSFNASTGAVINPKVVPKLQEAGPMAVSGNRLYVVDNNSVLVYDATSGAGSPSPLITGLDDSVGMAISGNRLYISSYATGAISVYDVTTGDQITPSLIPALTDAGAISISGSDLYVVGLNDNTVGVYNAQTGSAINASLFTGDSSDTLAVSIAPPLISSSLSATGTDGYLFGYRIVAANTPASFGGSGLPKGLSINQTTGIISGKPAVTGTFAVDISATNGGGSDTETLTLMIVPAPPVLTSVLTAVATVGQPFNYQITARNSPTSFNATGLPNGLSVDTSTGLISGTVTAGGTFPVTISAASDAGSASASLRLTANYTGIKGTYKGLAAVDGTDSGLFQLSLTPTGSFTGKITVPGKSIPIRGLFSTSGSFAGTITAGATTLDIDLAIDASVPDVTGSVTAITAAGSTTYLVEGDFPEAFKAGSAAPAVSGTYTVMISAVSGTGPGTPNLPGYGTMTVSSRGAISLLMKLGDGTPVTVRSQLNSDGQTWTLFDLLYAGRQPGYIAGTMVFESESSSDCDGALEWLKPLQTNARSYPGPFSIGAELLAARYSAPPLPSNTASLVLSGGHLVDSSTDSLMISPSNKVTVTGTDGLVLTLTPRTGAFSGHFLYPGTKKVTAFGGVIYQIPSPAGFGLFPDGDEWGEVDISP